MTPIFSGQQIVLPYASVQLVFWRFRSIIKFVTFVAKSES